MYLVEDTYRWHVGKRSITIAVLRRRYGAADDLRTLHAGCGTGAAMKGYLADSGPVTGFDLSTLSLGYRMKRCAEHRPVPTACP